MKKIFLFLALFAVFIISAAEITLAENGKAAAGIVIPENAKPIVKLAASELAEHLQKMTGARFKIGVKPVKKVNFYLGSGDAAGFADDEYVINAKGNRIDIYGKDTAGRVNFFNYFYDNPDKGSLRGVYNFLDSLGVRWLAPGKENVYVPFRKTLRIPEKSVRFKPVYQDRNITDAWNFTKVYPDAGEYVKKVDELFIWGIRNNVSTRNMVPGCHSERSLGLFKNKEWLAHPSAHQQMKNGKRNPNYSCWTDPFTKEIWLRAVDGYFSKKSPRECGFELNSYLHSKWPMPFIAPNEFMIDPMDHGGGNDGRCWCKRCEEFRKKFPCKDDTEMIWRVIGDIAGYVAKKYPGCYISTLVYPPKKLIPETIRKPENIRVRICMEGPRALIFSDKIASDMKLLKAWGNFLGPKNIPLWVYQCKASFGRFLPGAPDSYPHLIDRYIKKMQPYCAGMYCENHNLTHTFRNLDVYIFMRLIWDPNRNVEQELAEYFKLYYGPAAAAARKLFALFENNWIRIEKELLRSKNEVTGAVGNNKDIIQKKLWSTIYTAAEMKKIDALIHEMQKKAPAGSVYAKRVMLLQKYLVQIMKNERSEVMDKEEKRLALKLPVGFCTAKKFPAEQEWKKAKEFKLISADRMIAKLKAEGSFRMLHSADTLFLRVDLREPAMAASKTDMRHKSGNADIWKDNCIELFFYAEKSKKFWQIIINDNNAWSSQTIGRVLRRWEQMPGLRVKTRRSAAGWSADIAIPLKELKTTGKDLRFNMTRERNVKKSAPEFSTWSPLAMLGNWHGVDNYGTIVFTSGR